VLLVCCFSLPYNLCAQIALARWRGQTIDDPAHQPTDPVQLAMPSTISPVAVSTRRLTRTVSHRDLSKHFHAGAINEDAQNDDDDNDDNDDDKNVGDGWEMPSGLVNVDESSDDGHRPLDSEDEFPDPSKRPQPFY
jgi:hypothetical protein